MPVLSTLISNGSKGARERIGQRKLRLVGVVFWALLSATIASFAKPSSSGQQTQQKTPPAASAGAVAANAASPGNATANSDGFVRTSDGAPIPGAMVRLTNTATNQAWVSWTDSTGKFYIPLLAPGSYRIAASQLGFNSASIEAKLPATPAAPVSLVLRVATLAELAAPTGSGANRPRGTGFGGRGGGYGGRGGAAGGNPAAGNGSGRPGGYAGRGGRGGRGQVAGSGANGTNSDQSAAGSGFQQTDLTDEANATPDATQVGTSDAGNAAFGTGGGDAAASGDAFLLQGTVGQGAALGGPGGLGGPNGGFADLNVGAPAGLDASGLGGLGGNVPGGFGGGGGGFGGGPGGGGGFGGGGGGGRGGRGGGGGFGGGGRGGRGPGGPNNGGRLFRQAVNRVRYSFYDTYNNSALNAKPFSITGADVPKVATYNESVGGNLMGAIHIPHIYANRAGKTFLFLNYAHTTNEGAVNNLSTVPTADERAGNFCGVAGLQLYNPYSTFAGSPAILGNGCNLLTGALPLNPAATSLLAYIPSPNLSGTVQNFLLQARVPTNTDVVNVRVTQAINRKFNLNTAYSISSSRAHSLGNFPDTSGHSSTLGQSITIGLGHNWTTKLVENTQFSFSRSRSQSLSTNSYGSNIEAGFGIQGVSTNPINYGLPMLQFTSTGTLNDPIPSLTRNQTTGVTDAFTWVLTKHTITFGASLRRIDLNSDSSPQPRGAFTFNGQLTSAPLALGQISQVTPEQQSAYEFADFLLGLPYSTSVQYGMPQNLYLRSWDVAGYIQDDWRVNSHFTFVPGVRYEIHTPTVELYNHLANLDLAPNASAVAVITPDETGPYGGAFPRALIYGDGGHFAPRIGIAWLPPWKKPRTVVRAGYSMFYNETVYSSLVRKLTYQPPFDVAQSVITSSANILTLEQGLLPQPGIAITNTSGVSPFYKPAFTQIWTFGTETDLARDWILSLVYTGTKGTNLDLLRSPNRAPLGTPEDQVQQDRLIPDATGFTYDQSGANSIYNAFQARLIHRFTHGVSLQVQYTYSKAIDNASSIGGSGGTVVQQDGNYAAERGLSSFDMRDQLRITSTYELPFGQQKRFANHGWTLKLLGDWRLLNTFTWHTGTPFTAIMGGTSSDTSGTGASGSTRADYAVNSVGQPVDPNMGVCGGSAALFFNTAAFVAPPTGQYGDSRKDSIEGPCSFTWNVSMNKAFRLGSRDRQRRGEIQWSVTNVTNSVNYSGLGTTFGSSTFGRVTSAAGMRAMSLMLRFNF